MEKFADEYDTDTQIFRQTETGGHGAPSPRFIRAVAELLETEPDNPFAEMGYADGEENRRNCGETAAVQGENSKDRALYGEPEETSRINVLICTEEGILALYLRRMLERAGYAVIGQATNGSQAVEFAVACCPDLILMDTYFTEGDGIQTTREIIERAWRPIILLSDFPFEEDTLGGFPGGACGYLQKPFPGEHLLQMLDRLTTLFQREDLPCFTSLRTSLRR